MVGCGEIWGTFAQKVSDQFCQSIFGEENLAILTYYFEVTTIACVLPTVGVGRSGKMLEKVERCGDDLQSKSYEPV